MVVIEMSRITCSLQHSITTTIYLGIDIITQVPQVSEYLLDLEPSVVIHIAWHRDHCQNTHYRHHDEHFEEGETSFSLFGFSCIHNLLSITNSRPAGSGRDFIGVEKPKVWPICDRFSDRKLPYSYRNPGRSASRKSPRQDHLCCDLPHELGLSHYAAWATSAGGF